MLWRKLLEPVNTTSAEVTAVCWPVPTTLPSDSELPVGEGKFSHDKSLLNVSIEEHLKGVQYKVRWNEIRHIHIFLL